MTLQKFWSIPTWFLLCILQYRLPKEHPWRTRKFTLTDWFKGGTALCRIFDGLFWLSCFSLCRLLVLQFDATSSLATACQAMAVSASAATYFFLFKHFWGER